MIAFRTSRKDKEEDMEKLKSMRCVSGGHHIGTEAE